MLECCGLMSLNCFRWAPRLFSILRLAQFIMSIRCYLVFSVIVLFLLSHTIWSLPSLSVTQTQSMPFPSGHQFDWESSIFRVKPLVSLMLFFLSFICLGKETSGHKKNYFVYLRSGRIVLKKSVKEGLAIERKRENRGIADLIDWWSWHWNETQANEIAVSSLHSIPVLMELTGHLSLWDSRSGGGRQLVPEAIFNRPGSSLSDSLYPNGAGRFSGEQEPP